MDNFEILKKLGKGSFSKVFKVKRKADGQIYALKKVDLLNLSEKQKLNSLNEIRVLASIKSKYIVNYKEAFLDGKDSSLCLVMEYADKGDLSQRIEEQKKRNKYFNERDIWRIFVQLVKGLKSLHDINILHRDIKSSNIFLFSDGTAKLGDLNVCKILSKDVLGKTQAGTPSFAAPEVWMEKPYGLKSDIWSLGCVLYEIVTLKCPFVGNNVVDLYNKILIGEFHKIPKKFSHDLSYIIEHMIKFEPEKRISCDEILECDFVLNKIKTNDNNNLDELDESNDNILDEEEHKLLDTIHFPNNNLLYLNNQLPKANYSLEIQPKNKRNKKYNLNPIKVKSDLNTLSLSENYNKHNSDGKLFRYPNIKRHSQRTNISTNLNSLFNKDSIKNKNDIDISKSNNSIKNSSKEPIKMKRLTTNLCLLNDLNKNKAFSSEKIVHNKVNLSALKETKNKIEKNEINDVNNIENLDNIDQFAKEIKKRHFYDTDKLIEILFNNNKKRKKSHGPIKDFKYFLKRNNENCNNVINVINVNINNRFSNSNLTSIKNNNNEYKQIPTDINISNEDKNINKNKYQLSPMKLSCDINKNFLNFSNKCLPKYNSQKNKNEFLTNFTKKENSDNILPKLKSSYNRNFDG